MANYSAVLSVLSINLVLLALYSYKMKVELVSRGRLPPDSETKIVPQGGEVGIVTKATCI